MKRVAVFSNAPVGGAMSSPAIRALHLARELSRELDVVLMAPGAPNDIDGVRTDPVTTFAAAALAKRLERYDAVVAQKLPPATMRRLARSATRVVYDLYTPALAEGLVSVAVGGGNETLRRLAALEAKWQQLALAMGNAFVCPGERQRDFWLGMLAEAGRIDLATYRADPSLRSLIDVVPFGLPDEPPQAARRVLKGVVPGIRDTDRVLLWAGGIVNWSDPAPVIRAVARLAGERDDVKLYFLGFRPPDAAPPAEATRAVALARELGVLDRAVFFHDTWVAYDERQAFLLEADVGVAAYRETFESRVAFRARLLDYFWAGLPTITTRGDELGDRVEERRLGRAVGFGDVEGWVDAIEQLLDDAALRARVGANLESIREELRWERCAEPLLRLLRDPGGAVPTTRARRRLELETAWARARVRLAHASSGARQRDDVL